MPNQNNFAKFNQDTSKIFVWDNRTEQYEINNPTYDDVEYPAGTLFGRISATGLLAPLEYDAADGSQFPIGILFQDSVVPEGETVKLTLCVSGDVVQDKVILQSGTTWDSVISGRRLFDRVGSDTVGIKLVASEELTEYDNQIP